MYICYHGCGRIITDKYYNLMIEKSKHPPRCLCRINAGSEQAHSLWRYKRGLGDDTFDKYMASKTFTPSRIELARHFYDLGREICIEEVESFKIPKTACSCVDDFECLPCAASVNTTDYIIERLKADDNDKP